MEYHVSDDVSGECPPNMGFKASRANQIIAKHDDEHDFELDDLVLRIYVKHEPSCSDVVVLQRSPKREVIFACHAFKDDIDADTPLSALETLKRFIDKFGMTFRVDTFEGKLLNHEQIPISPSANQVELFGLVNPEKHTCLPVLFYRKTRTHVDVSLAFFINITLYSRSLAAH